MLVHDVMQSGVITVAPAATVADALALLGARGIRHLVVVRGDALAGIVSDRDLKVALADDRLGRQALADVMTRAVITIEPAAPVEDAARLMLADRVSALPVVEAGELVGIITETDILRLFLRALGVTEPSSRLDVGLGRDAAALPDVVATIHAAGTPISSLVTLGGPGGAREAVIRVATIDPGPAIRALTAKGYTVATPWRGPARGRREV